MTTPGLQIKQASEKIQCSFFDKRKPIALVVKENGGIIRWKSGANNFKCYIDSACSYCPTIAETRCGSAMQNRIAAIGVTVVTR
jgi:hypothetical protein